MAPILTERASLGDQSTGAGGLSHDDIVRIVIGIVLAATTVALLWMFWSGKYSCLIARFTKAPPATAPRPTFPTGRTRGGATAPTASFPRFARDLRDAMHIPKISSEPTRPTTSRRACPTGMLSPHTRRGSDTSTNSRVGLLRAQGPVSVPASPQPAFLGGRVTAGKA